MFTWKPPDRWALWLKGLLCASLSFLFGSVCITAMHRSLPASEEAGGAMVMFLLGLLASGVLCVRLWRLLKEENRPFFVLVILCLWQMLLQIHIPICLFLAGYWSSQADWKPSMGWLLGAASALLLPFMLKLLNVKQTPRIVKGQPVKAMEEARAIIKRHTSPDDVTTNLAGIAYPTRNMTVPTAIVGASGSGKTALTKAALASFIQCIKPGSDCRMLYFDMKGDGMEILSGMPLHPDCKINLFDPFDKRGERWAIAKDITGPAPACQAANILIKNEGHHDRFWTESARKYCGAVMAGLALLRPGKWTLADVLHILSSIEKTDRLIELIPQLRHLKEEHARRDPRTTMNIHSTIDAFVNNFWPIAALSSHASEEISLNEWIQSESILVLTCHETLRTSMTALNEVCFQRIAELILSLTESTSRRIVIAMDETKEAGRHELLARLQTNGRSKGMIGLFSWQTMEGLRSIYGTELADEIAGICAHKIFLPTDSPITAKYASDCIGSVLVEETTTSRHSGEKPSTTHGTSIVERKLVLESELMRLPRPTRDRFVVSGYAITPLTGPFEFSVNLDGVLYPMGSEPSFLPRPEEHQYMDPAWKSVLDELEEPHAEPESEPADTVTSGLRLEDIGRDFLDLDEDEDPYEDLEDLADAV